MSGDLRIKRIYDPIEPDDGARVLVDRIWPRGIAKQAAALSLWLKEIAPSAALRQWFGHDPNRWVEFRRRYRRELESNSGAVDRLRDLAAQGRATLLFAAHDRDRNNAAVLAEYLQPKLKSRGAADKVRAPSSPVCFAGEADAAYMGYATREELLAFLNELLEAERAGAKVTLHMAAEMKDRALKSTIDLVHHDEAKWCALLTRAIKGLGAEPSTRTGAFHEKVMAIADLPGRLALLNRGQGWVARKLRETLPKIQDEALRNGLTDMLTSHEHNIRMVEEVNAAK